MNKTAKIIAINSELNTKTNTKIKGKNKAKPILYFKGISGILFILNWDNFT